MGSLGSVQDSRSSPILAGFVPVEFGCSVRVGSAGAEGPKSIHHKHLGAKVCALRTDEGFDRASKRGYNGGMKKEKISDFTASFLTEDGANVIVRALTGQRVVSVEFDWTDRASINLTVQEACSLRSKLGEALRVGFGLYAD